MIVPRWCEPFIGIPYQLLGRSMQGADCWGLVVMVYRARTGIELPWYGDTSVDDMRVLARLVNEQKQTGLWRKVERAEVAALDVVLMRGRGEHSYALTHVGVMVTDKVMLHTQLDGSPSHVVALASPLVSTRVHDIRRHVRVAVAA